jgi:predicted GIY-YIG superfamily endonuclease
MLRLQNDCIYVGSTDDLDRRWAEHQSGNGGKTTSDSRPVALIYLESVADGFEARKRERQLKRWSRAKKLALAKGHFDVLHRLAKRHG